jgi:hypothetical protein
MTDAYATQLIHTLRQIVEELTALRMEVHHVATKLEAK